MDASAQPPATGRRGFFRAAVLVGAVAAGAVLDGEVTHPAEAAVRRRVVRKRVPRKPIARKPAPRKPVPRRPVVHKPVPKPVPTPVPKPVPSPTVPSDEAFALHLLRRTTFGITPALLAEITATGPQGWLDRQLAPAGIDDHACDALLTRFPLAFAEPPAVYAAVGNGGWESMQQVVQATLVRQAWSDRQLFEVMADFWSNHLNITCPSSEPWATKAMDDRAVIRAHALGRFEDMLAASVRSPAMLLYLSNSESRGDAPNENYGRELMELHTVGVDAGYGHDGVVASALALTGMTVWNPWNGGTAGTNGLFRYRSDWHHVGPLSVLGWTHPNADPDGGEAVAESLARYLARHPATAARIARKLAVRFVSDTPPQGLVDRLTTVYLDNDTAVVPVLRALFASQEFAASTGQKYRRPAEDVLATIRSLGVTVDTSGGTTALGGLSWLLEQLGNAPLGWHPPNGYPDVAPAWAGAGTTLGRWNAHVAIAQGWMSEGLVYHKDLAAHLLGAVLPTSRSALVDALCARLLPGQAVAAAHRAALVAFLGPDGPLGDGDATWLFPTLVALVLDSPYWSVR